MTSTIDDGMMNQKSRHSTKSQDFALEWGMGTALRHIPIQHPAAIILRLDV